jgi:hypothetical protein
LLVTFLLVKLLGKYLSVQDFQPQQVIPQVGISVVTRKVTGRTLVARFMTPLVAQPAEAER